MRLPALGQAVACVLALSGCTEKILAPGGVGASVVVAPGDGTLVVGDTLRLVASVLDLDGRPLTYRTITWASSDPSVATVSDGLVVAVGRGPVTIYAAAESFADSAVLVVVEPFRAVQVVAGTDHSCAVTETGAAYCWGRNRSGMIGNGLLGGDFRRPSRVVSLVSFASVTIGQYHTCALGRNATAYCWGDNSSGTFDPAASSPSALPLALPGAEGVLAVVAGDNHTCVLRPGTTSCWGNLQGTSIIPLTSLASGGYHQCGLIGTGRAYCWGANDFGAIGDSTTSYRSSPTPVTGAISFASIEPGWRSTCALDTGGAAWCWGANVDGQLGDGSKTNRSFPVAVLGGVSFKAISGGYAHSCGIGVDGTAYCWGRNDQGQVGDGSFKHRLTPVPVAGSLKFVSISAGIYHTCGVADTGIVYCWGWNAYGQIGDDSAIARGVPTAVWAP